MNPKELDAVFAALTSRHLDVLAAVTRERRHARVARRLGIAVSTVRSHLRELYEIAGCHSVDELAVWWESHADAYLAYVARRIGRDSG